jgi:acyl-CoA synthetase (AMP-forming)/AMP-acid ligase II
MRENRNKFNASGELASLHPAMSEGGGSVERYSWVLERFVLYGELSCFVNDQEAFSFADLLDRMSRWQEELDQMGIKPGQIIGLVVQERLHCLALFLTLLVNRNVIVPLADDVADREQKWRVAGVRYWFDSGSGKWCEIPDAACPGLIEELHRENDGGVVIFTSGTTGKSKAALLPAASLLGKFEKVKKVLKSLIFLKLDHIGGIHTLLAIWLNGGCIVCCKDRSVQAVCQTVEEKKIELLPTTPSFLNMLLMSSSYRDYDLSSLKVITYGTEPMPGSTLKALHEVFPEIKLKQTYGLTELDIFSTQSKSSGSTWMKITGEGVFLEVRNGELWVRTTGGMKGYLNAPSPFDDEGWYNTGDRVEKEGEYYRILGRKHDLINVGGEKVYPVEVESVLLEMPYVQDVKVEGKYSPVLGQIVSAIFVLEKVESARELKQRMKSFCSGRLERFKIPAVVRISEQPLMGHRFKKARIAVKQEDDRSSAGFQFSSDGPQLDNLTAEIDTPSSRHN